MLELIKTLFGSLQQSGFKIDEFDIAPPCENAPVEIVGIPVPMFLRDFYENHASGLAAAYIRDITADERLGFGDTLGASLLSGGPVIFGAEELAEARQRAEDFVSRTGIPHDDDLGGMWLSAVPFSPIGNGDYLGFNAPGQVVYLSHDDTSFILANSMDEFWGVWARVYFVGPEVWMLSAFSQENGMLNPRSANIGRFRKAFESLLE